MNNRFGNYMENLIFDFRKLYLHCCTDKLHGWVVESTDFRSRPAWIIYTGFRMRSACLRRSKSAAAVERHWPPKTLMNPRSWLLAHHPVAFYLRLFFFSFLSPLSRLVPDEPIFLAFSNNFHSTLAFLTPNNPRIIQQQNHCKIKFFVNVI